MKETTKFHTMARVHAPQVVMTAEFDDGWLTIRTGDASRKFTGELAVRWNDIDSASAIVAAINSRYAANERKQP